MRGRQGWQTESRETLMPNAEVYCIIGCGLTVPKMNGRGFCTNTLAWVCGRKVFSASRLFSYLPLLAAVIVSIGVFFVLHPVVRWFAKATRNELPWTRQTLFLENQGCLLSRARRYFFRYPLFPAITFTLIYTFSIAFSLASPLRHAWLFAAIAHFAWDYLHAPRPLPRLLYAN